MPKNKTNKREQISSKLIKDNNLIVFDKEKTNDSGEESNKQKISEQLDISKIINSKKRIGISSDIQCNIDIVEDKDKSPNIEEPVTKSIKNIKNIDYYKNNIISDQLDISEISEKVTKLNVSINSKKRIGISSDIQCNIDIVEDKDKTPACDEPVTKSSKTIKNMNSEYYQNNKEEIIEKSKERSKTNYPNNKEKIIEKSKDNYHKNKDKNKEKERIKDLNDNTKDKLLFDKNYKIEINFQTCAICGYESGLNNMKLITNDIEEYFISCGLRDLYNIRLETFRTDNYDELYISDFIKQFTINGVLNNHKYICKHCYENIRTKKKKCKKNNNNNHNNNTGKDNQKNLLLNKSVISDDFIKDKERKKKISLGLFY